MHTLVEKAIRLAVLAILLLTSLWLGVQVGERTAGSAYRLLHAGELTGAERAGMRFYDYFGRTTELPAGYVGVRRSGRIVGLVVVGLGWGSLLWHRSRRGSGAPGGSDGRPARG